MRVKSILLVTHSFKDIRRPSYLARQHPDCHNALLSSSLMRTRAIRSARKCQTTTTNVRAWRYCYLARRQKHFTVSRRVRTVYTAPDEVCAISRRKPGCRSPWQQMPRRLTAALAAADADAAARPGRGRRPPHRRSIARRGAGLAVTSCQTTF